MKKLMIIHRERAKLQRDSWTHGDWRQYVAFLDDGSAICCRISGLPATLAVAGFIILALAGMGFLTAGMGVPVYWWRIYAFAFVGFALLGPWLITWFTPWRMIVPVSEKMVADENGSYWRHF